ncbi:hypothetical protein [Bacillus andreraoultii]|uniref:hypothetical protein n=1 Tax=Bacillus andreraoultii TaxID=1499685 RepID=UPI000A695B62|nr:hypothetical protein [Bacillus andreraoultii]
MNSAVNRNLLQGEVEDFLTAFFKEYKCYFKEILRKDPNAIQHDSVTMMINN